MRPATKPTRLLAVLALLALLGAWTPARAQEGNARAETIARTSPPARAALAFVESHSRRIRDRSLRSAVRALLANPAPIFMALHPEAAARERVYQALVEAGFLDPAASRQTPLFPPLPDPSRAPLSFLAAPGGTTSGHHAYPGGLAEHTAFNWMRTPAPGCPSKCSRRPPSSAACPFLLATKPPAGPSPLPGLRALPALG